MSDPHAALHAHFGFPAFRPGQEMAVRAALGGRDVLVVMPTGAGKSLCYQLPALMRDDLTLVVSPLVSLMEDQVQALARRAPGQVALISAQQDAAANAAAVAAAVRGDVRVLYVAPERFSTPGFARALRPARIGLFVVDEAHCVSQWGNDFRPDYFRLADAARWLGAEAIVASTATATPQVAADIVARLGLRDPVSVATGFDRPNLAWSVVPSTPRLRERQVLAALAAPGATPAIVYAGTRRDVDHLAGKLAAALGRPVAAYHAGLERAARADAQRRFMDGTADVVVATNAFGMGIDKADVRTVVHATVPPSVEAYYQEAGRAGRDGAPARAVLLAAPKDKGLHVFFIQRAEVTEEHVERIALRLQARAGGAPAGGAPAPVFDVAVRDLGGEHDEDRVKAVVGALARAGVLQLAPAAVGRVRGRLLRGFDTAARAACRAIAADAQRARWRQYRAIWGYADATRCRRTAILAHFGDVDAPARGAGCCDVCDPTVLPEALRAGGKGLGREAVPPTAADLDGAIIAVVAEVPGRLGRDGVVEILRGVRSAALLEARLDGLPEYAAWGDHPVARLGAAVDGLVDRGALVGCGGAHPALRVADTVQERLVA